MIVYPTWYSGQLYENEWLVGDRMALDTAKQFIIIPNMLGNGLSSSPGNSPEPYSGPRFPNVTAYDNVHLQHRLVTGWTMGALQTLHWERCLRRWSNASRHLRVGKVLTPQLCIS
jgi:homoserine O-acetyltransferase